MAAPNNTITTPSGEVIPYGYAKSDTVSKFWRDKYEKEANKYWDKFYKANTTNFFKDRHWIDSEFEDLRPAASPESSDSSPTAPVSHVRCLEVGCGVGNTVFPLLESNPNLFFYAFDFSARAVQLLKEHPLYASTGRCSGHVCDIVNDPLPTEIALQSLDFVMMIFVLSAISPQKFDTALSKLAHVVKPGGAILFRDYAVGDLAQERLSGKSAKTQKIEENFFVRGDGTRAYYFGEAELIELMRRNGFELSSCKVVEKVIENRKTQEAMRRLWLNGKFVRTSEPVELKSASS